MADINRALDHVIKVEGGFVNHPNDPGGATKYGITQKTLNAWTKATGDNEFNVRFLSKYQAREIYKKMYWNPMNLDHALRDNYATIVFDQAINQGSRPVVARLQHSINRTMRGAKLKVDGKLGPKTLMWFNQAKRSTMIDFIKHSQLFYVELVTRKPDQFMPFLKGWLIRSQKLLDLVFET